MFPSPQSQPDIPPKDHSTEVAPSFNPYIDVAEPDEEEVAGRQARAPDAVGRSAPMEGIVFPDNDIFSTHLAQYWETGSCAPSAAEDWGETWCG